MKSPYKEIGMNPRADRKRKKDRWTDKILFTGMNDPKLIKNTHDWDDPYDARLIACRVCGVPKFISEMSKCRGRRVGGM